MRSVWLADDDAIYAIFTELFITIRISDSCLPIGGLYTTIVYNVSYKHSFKAIYGRFLEKGTSQRIHCTISVGSLPLVFKTTLTKKNFVCDKLLQFVENVDHDWWFMVYMDSHLIISGYQRNQQADINDLILR